MHTMAGLLKDLSCINPSIHKSITPLPYGFIKKTPQGKNQQAQTAQEVALESSQEAHLAAVICLAH
jgi:hypothetical protein